VKKVCVNVLLRDVADNSGHDRWVFSYGIFLAGCRVCVDRFFRHSAYAAETQRGCGIIRAARRRRDWRRSEQASATRVVVEPIRLIRIPDA
jgi:hypothetical protein